MPAPAILVVLIAAAELRSPATKSMVQAARETLGPAVTVRLEGYHPPEGKPAPHSLEEATAYVVVSWQNGNHERATIEGHVTGTRDDVSHSLQFAPADPEEERGRSIGFVIASIVAGPTQVGPYQSDGDRPFAQPPSAQHRQVLSPAMPADAPRKYSFSLAAVGTLPGSASSFGAYLDAAREFSSNVGLGLYAEGRFGAVPRAQSNTRFLSAGATGRFHVTSLARPTDLSLLLQVGVTQGTVTHLSEDDTVPDAKTAYFLSGSASVRLAYELSDLASLYADLGAESLSGEIRVNIHGSTAATIPVLFAIGRLGLRARF